MLAALLAPLAPSLASAEEPSRLSGGEWLVTSVSGALLPDGVRATIEFDGSGRVGGQSGCNRFTGGYVQDGLAITFSQLASTRMACPPPAMEAEIRIMAALAQVESFSLTPGGALELLGDDGLLLHALRD